MPRISPVDWKILIEIFERYGCKYERKKGSHHILSHINAKRAVVIPEYDEVDVEIIKNNMRTVGMNRQEYLDLLQEIK
ncbi:MAG: type II toxin-antitoxin system HicA family toxin [bacterium]|nr:type II toxin-antitoxin system HicA family toxin [bacterium]